MINPQVGQELERQCGYVSSDGDVNCDVCSQCAQNGISLALLQKPEGLTANFNWGASGQKPQQQVAPEAHASTAPSPSGVKSPLLNLDYTLV